MATGRKSSPSRKSKVASKSNAWIWIGSGLGFSWLAILEPTGRDIVLGFLGWGGLFLGPFMALTGLLRMRMSSQRQATAWRNRFIISTPLISVIASAPSLGPDGASTGGGLLGDFVPMMLSSVIGDVSFWLCSGLALFAVYWVLGRPLLRREVLDDLGVKEILDDAFGDIDGSAGLDESMDTEGAEPRTIEPTPRSKVEEKRKNREEKRNIDTPESNEPENEESQAAPVEHPRSRENRALREPRSTPGSISNEEASYLPLADPEPDLPLTLEMFGELESEQPREQVTLDTLTQLTDIIVGTVKTLEKIELVPLADPIVGMSNICFEFEPKEHSKSLTAIASLTKDLSVATNREQVRVNISSSVRVELSLYTEEREFAPILPLLQEVADVDLEAAPQYLIGRDQERAPYQLDAGSTLHMLVGGSTGGGKSVLLHSIIWGLVFRYPPSKVRLILYDHKMEEFAHYRSLPHLWQPVITNEGGFNRMLENASAELKRRMEAKVADPNATFTWLIIIMDEFRGITNDEFIEFISMARSFQIRVILGTQRANKESIHTTVKNNLGTNIALKVRDFRESRLIIGEPDAKDLLMDGDCLVDSPKGLDRVQVGFVDKQDLMALREEIS